MKYIIEIKWAFIFIDSVLSWVFLEKLGGLHTTRLDPQQYLTMLYIIPAVWIYVLALKNKKRKFYSGQLSFKQGFLSGMVIAIIITLLSPVTQWVISSIITPGYFTNVIAYSVKTGYYKSVEEGRSYFNFRNHAIQSAVWFFITGVITSAIVSYFVRTKHNKL